MRRIGIARLIPQSSSKDSEAVLLPSDRCPDTSHSSHSSALPGCVHAPRPFFPPPVKPQPRHAVALRAQRFHPWPALASDGLSRPWRDNEPQSTLLPGESSGGQAKAFGQAPSVVAGETFWPPRYCLRPGYSNTQSCNQMHHRAYHQGWQCFFVIGLGSTLAEDVLRAPGCLEAC